MSTVGGGVNIVRDGLVMYLDASNTKSLADVPSQNLLPWSQDFTNVNWNKMNITVTANTTTAPDLSNTANSVIPNTVNGDHSLNENGGTVNSANTYTISVYVKSNGYNFVRLSFEGAASNVNYTFFNLSNGTIGNTSSMLSNTITNVGNGWYRCSSTRTTDFSGLLRMTIYVTSANSQFSYTGDGVSGLYLWGTQLELGSVATTYIPTTTVAASRVPTWTDISKGGNNGILTSGFTYNYSNGGSLFFNGATSFITISNPINQSNLLQEWTVMVWINISDKTSQTLLGGLNLGLYVCYSQGNNSLLALNDSSGGDYYTYGGDLGGIGWVLVSFIFKNLTGERYIYRNGVNITTSGPNVSSNPFGISSTLVIGQISTGNLTRAFQGLLSNIQIYNRALSPSEVLQNYNAAKSKFGL